ncbi:hypothetical protein [Pleomorphovibrio marinus]|nr:hypothetical protein [Pleomorphovibrio marinus]
METLVKNGWMSVREFADQRGITVQAVYMGIKAGRYESRKIGTYTLVRA